MLTVMYDSQKKHMTVKAWPMPRKPNVISLAFSLSCQLTSTRCY